MRGTRVPYPLPTRGRFTLHSIIYRLLLGAVVLAVVIPVWAGGHRPMWPVSLITIFVVAALGVLFARQRRLREWLRQR
jgi:Flp pilus assembly protein TadB